MINLLNLNALIKFIEIFEIFNVISHLSFLSLAVFYYGINFTGRKYFLKKNLTDLRII